MGTLPGRGRQQSFRQGQIGRIPIAAGAAMGDWAKAYSER